MGVDKPCSNICSWQIYSNQPLHIKANKYVTWAAVLIPGLMLLASCVGKFIANEATAKVMAGSGFASNMPLLGILEVLVAVFYMVPATRRIGFYLVCSYLGGAMAFHIGRSEPF